MKIEIRGKDRALISGYVNAVERRSKVLRYPGEPPFREIVKAGTFDRALRRGGKVEMRLDHGRTLCDTQSVLELREDNVGLYASAEVTDEETVEAAKSGHLTGWSFGFRCLHENKQIDSDGVELRELDDIELLEVSILSKKTPAYIATSVEVRDNGEPVEQRSSEDAVTVNVQTGADTSAEEAELEILKLYGGK